MTLKYPFDGIEALNGRSVKKSNIRSERLARRVGKPFTAGSDAHTPHHIGEGLVHLPDDLTTWQEVVEYIMSGKPVEVSSHNRTPKDTLKYGTKSITEWIFRGFKRM